MSQNGQAQYKDLVALQHLLQDFYSVSYHYGKLFINGLNKGYASFSVRIFTNYNTLYCNFMVFLCQLIEIYLCLYQLNITYKNGRNFKATLDTRTINSSNTTYLSKLNLLR